MCVHERKARREYGSEEREKERYYGGEQRKNSVMEGMKYETQLRPNRESVTNMNKQKRISATQYKVDKKEEI